SGGKEHARWQEYLQKLSEKFGKKQSRTEDIEDAEAEAPAKPQIFLKRPCHGRFPATEFGACVPPEPASLEFEQFPGIDGKPRLAFSAAFESGNLALAQCESPSVYTLMVDVDVNTDGYTQWFYFAVRGGALGAKVTFRLANMAKSSSLFGDKGMRPVVWSEKGQRGWERGCSEVNYKANDPYGKGIFSSNGQKQWFTLSFAYTWEHDDDTVFFAYHYPYTYSYLCSYLDSLAAHPYAGSLFTRRVLCYTIGGLPCEALDVNVDTDDVPAGFQRGLAVITARVHPGESNASWMMHGFISFLLSPAAEAKALRQAFKWLIVPMLNPDGVVRGCYRCSLAGTDLNRVYLKPNKMLHAEIYHLKEAMKSAGTVDLFIDFHGHSKKEGIFFYGGKAEDRDRNGEIQLLPRLCCLGSSDFKWNKCAFNVFESKISTARLVGFLQLRIQRAYTVEASFASNGKAQAKDLFDQNDPDEQHEHEDQEYMEHEDVQPEARARSMVAEEAATALLQLAAPQAEGGQGRDALRARKGSRTDVSLSFIARKPHHSHNSSGSESEKSAEKADENSNQRTLKTEPEAEGPGTGKGAVSPGRHKAKQEREAEADRAEFNASRLELAGPVIGRAICAVWQLELPIADGDAGDLLNGPEAKQWPHLHYHRLTAEMAQWELAKLISGKCGRGKDDDESGSDSNPSADEKPAAELRKLQKRLARKFRKQKTFKLEQNEEPEEEIKYKVVVAFGKSMKIPLKPGEKAPGAASRRASRTAEAAEKFMRRRHSDISGMTGADRAILSNKDSRQDAEKPKTLAPPDSESRENTKDGARTGRSLSNKSGATVTTDERERSPSPSPTPAPASPSPASPSPASPSPASHSPASPTARVRPSRSKESTPRRQSVPANLRQFQMLPSFHMDEPDERSAAASPKAKGQEVDALQSEDPEISRIPTHRRMSRRESNQDAEATNIVYSPGVPLVTGSGAEVSTIQIELPASVVEVPERRQSVHLKANPVRASRVPSIVCFSPPAEHAEMPGCQSPVSPPPEVHEVKTTHVTLPDIAGPPAILQDHRRTSLPTAEATVTRVWSPPASSGFKEWMESQTENGDAPEGDVLWRSPAQGPAQGHTRRSTPQAKACGGPPPGWREAPRVVSKEAAPHLPVAEGEDVAKFKVSKVSVHFRSAPPVPTITHATPAKVTPHSQHRARPAHKASLA
ncbi:unnamed protein product, partial [Effrenium voratum]